jgi:hypothetical protein
MNLKPYMMQSSPARSLNESWGFKPQHDDQYIKRRFLIKGLPRLCQDVLSVQLYRYS